MLKADPKFSDALEKRDQLADRIRLVKQEFSVKKSQVHGQIAKFRQELSQAQRQAQQKLRQMNSQLDADRQRLAFALSMAHEEFKVKQQQRDSVGRSISRLRKALKEAQPPWTDSDRAKMDRELADLLQEPRRLDQELDGLRSHLKLLKHKQTLLRL
ncbi:MAG: hypothetical protein AAB289_02780 [Chloroflexota bacterium]